MNVVVAGNGVSCITMIKEIRKHSSEPRIEVFTDEPRPFYWRPRLVEMLAGEANEKEITPYDPKWYEDNGVVLHLSDPVTALDTSPKKATSESGKTFSYDAFVFANGAKPYVPPIPGRELDGVFTVRTVEDVEKIRGLFGKSKKFVVIGGGILGLETAAALGRAGEKEVTVVEFFPYLLPRQIDAPGASVLRALIERKYGMKLLLGKTTASVEGNGSAERVGFSDGSYADADAVIISAGVRPDIVLARNSGIRTEKGIVVDDFMRTGTEGVYAIGDVAQHREKVYGIVPPAIEQAKVLGNILCSKDSRYSGSVPSAMLKIAGIELMSVGEFEPSDGESVFSSLGSLAGGFYKKIVVRDNFFTGAVTVGVKKTEALKLKKMVDDKAGLSGSILEYVRKEEDN